MKKVLTVIVLLTALVLVLGGCSDGKSTDMIVANAVSALKSNDVDALSSLLTSDAKQTYDKYDLSSMCKSYGDLMPRGSSLRSDGTAIGYIMDLDKFGDVVLHVFMKKEGGSWRIYNFSRVE